MNRRTRQSNQLLKMKNPTKRVSEHVFQVRSQKSSDKYYEVVRTGDGSGLTCSCDDNKKKGSDCKHIHAILEQIKTNVYDDLEYKMIDRKSLKCCSNCDSGNTKLAGNRSTTKRGLNKKYYCHDCKKWTAANSAYKKRHFTPETICGALSMYFRGMSCRDVSTHYKSTGIKVHYSTVYRWIERYSIMTSIYTKGIIPRVGMTTRADEVYMHVAGKRMYLFASMDNATRFWIAGEMFPRKDREHCDELFIMTKQQIGKIPLTLITDGHMPYMKSCIRIFGQKCEHIRNITLRGDRNNNAMERLNGEIRDREKVTRGLKKMDSAIIEGMRVYYNFDKPHLGLGGLTPAEMAGIKIMGDNHWDILIRNAAHSNLTN